MGGRRASRGLAATRRWPSTPHLPQRLWVAKARSLPPPPAATCGVLPRHCRGTLSSWSSWWTLAWPWDGVEVLLGKIPPALNLAAPAISIPPHGAPRRAHTPPPLWTCPGCARRSLPTPRQSATTGCRGGRPGSAGPRGVGLTLGSSRDSALTLAWPRPRSRRSGWHQPRLLLCSPGKPASTHPACARIPAANGSPLPHPTNTAAPPVCNAEPHQRAAGARERRVGATGGGRRGVKEERGGDGGRREGPAGGARAPLPLMPRTRRCSQQLPCARPRGSRDQSASAGGAEPSAGRAHWFRHATQVLESQPESQACKLRLAGADLPAQVGRPAPCCDRRGSGKGESWDLPGKPVPRQHPELLSLLRLQIPSCMRPRRPHPGQHQRVHKPSRLKSPQTNLTPNSA